MEEQKKHIHSKPTGSTGQEGGSAHFEARSPSQRQAGQNLRRELDRRLSTAPLGMNSVSIWTFGLMNRQMEREGQPLAQEHYNVLVDSLLTQRRGLVRTLWAENPEVMKTTGNTCVYNAGKTIVHTPLSWLRSSSSSSTGGSTE